MSLQAKEAELICQAGLGFGTFVWRFLNLCVFAQISTEESSFSPSRPATQKPLKPALKRSSVVERPTEIPTGKKHTLNLRHTRFQSTDEAIKKRKKMI